MNQFEFPGLTAKLKDKMDWLRGTMDAKHVTVKLTELELAYIQSCMAFYVYEASMRRAEKLPLAQIPDTLPCETEVV
jgi:hypothetical protein